MSNPVDDLVKRARSISPAWLARLRTGATLLVLVLVVAIAVRIGVDRVAEPFPESADAPICTDTAVASGDPVTVGEVTVSIINAGGADGLAGRTLSDLADRGFGRGQLADAKKDTPRVRNAQIWTTGGTTAAVKLVQSYLVGKVTIVDREGPLGGITVLVGEDFSDVKDGRKQIRARDDETTCVPTVPVESPTTPAAS